ncbi:enhancer of split mbeta protein-like isoform X2 [Cherax quadricarinatus]|uniref:enhancer of split mbeta protein-like isoform X2 n=1 Tax=Cherax quadricarinatus TaxID=27406 RepID=UPI00387ED447
MGVPKMGQDESASTGPVTDGGKVSQDGRKVMKSTEEKRLDRISSCMEELSALLAEERRAKTDDGCKSAMQEKTDMLELTMRHWQSAMAVSSARSSDKEAGTERSGHTSDPGNSSYLKGYKQCIQVVNDVLKASEGPDAECLRQELVQHLSSKVQELTPSSVSAGENARAGVPVISPPSASAETEQSHPASLENAANISAIQGHSKNSGPSRKDTITTTTAITLQTSPCVKHINKSEELKTSKSLAPVARCAGCQKTTVTAVNSREEFSCSQPPMTAHSNFHSKVSPVPKTLNPAEVSHNDVRNESHLDLFQRPTKSRRLLENEECAETDVILV